MSGSLFKNLQCKFRDDNYKEATTRRLEVDHDIAIKKDEVKLETDKRNQTKYEKQQLQNSQLNIKKKQMEYDRLLINNKEAIERFKQAQTEQLTAKKRAVAESLTTIDLQQQQKEARNKQNVKRIDENYKYELRLKDGQIFRQQQGQKLTELDKKQEIDFKKMDLDLFKEKMQDPRYATNMR